MIKRKALLIGAPDGKIPGVAIDIKNMKKFLLSAMGGAWVRNEITVMENPKKQELMFELNKLYLYDYSFIFFAGHGYYSSSKECTILNINKAEILNSMELRKGAKKHTLILDCCREIVNDLILEHAFESMAFDKANIHELNLLECRKYFDKKITECSSGITIMNSCDLNETAGENSKKGGYYCFSLINAAKELVENKLKTIDINKKYKVFSCNECHDEASIKVKELSGDRQNPIIESSRSEFKFPFAVVA